MGGTLAEMSVSFSADISNLSSGIQQAEQKVSGFESDVQSKASGLSSHFSGLLGGIGSFAGHIGSLAGDALGLVTNAAGEAFGFLKDQMVDSVKIAMAHQEIMTQTAQAIKSTGDASGMSAQAISGLADSLSQVTPFSEDTVQSGENLLLTFTGIGKQVFPQATQAMLDMATAMHSGPQQGAIMLGKALNDPLTGLSALQRVGVTFSASEKEQIKTMMAHNDIIGAQGVMLKELNTEFGGSAKAAGTTFAGSMAILSNKFEDFKQKVGTAVLPILGQLVGFISSAVTPVLDTVSNALESPGFQSFVSGVGKGIATAFTDIGTAIAPIGRDLGIMFKQMDFGEFLGSFKTLGGTITGLLSPVTSLGSTFKQFDFSGIIEQLGGGLARGMGFATEAINGLAGGLKSLGSGGLASLIPSSLQSALSNVTGLFKTLGGVWNDDIRPGLAELLPAFQSFGNTLQSSVGSAVEQVSKIFSGQFGANMKFIGQEAQNLGKWFKTDLAPAIAQAEPGFAKLASVILTTVVPGLAQLWAIGQQVARHVIADFIPVFEKATPIIVKIAGIVANGLGGALKFLMPYIVSAGQAVGKFAGEIADRVAPILMHFWDQIATGLNWLETNWKYIWPSLSLILKGTWDIISGIVKVAWSLVSGIIKIGLDILSGNWSQAWTDLKDMLSGIWSGIQTIIQGQIENIKGIFSGLAQMAISWGENLISGFVSGITNSLGQVGNAMSGVVNTIGSFLPHSPAKQGELSHLNEYGPNFMKGFSEGITKSKPMLETAMNMTIAPVKAAVAYPASSSSHPAVASYPSGGGGGGSANAALLAAINNLAVAFANHQHGIYMDTNKVGSTLTQHMKQVKGIRG